ncbi:hypothetical protein [Paraburkholderia sp. Ac-20347]|uniref:hypothetical protein n=1 Tax=Paraburkholderia sp. Ac-20347 TaxID=2703892 RepID=UPI0019806321|nr:hypothetical protein [Paraburkholderia sp. Ac-20347]
MAPLRLRRESRKGSIAHFFGHTPRIIMMPPRQRGTQLARLPVTQQPDAPVAARDALLQQRKRRGGIAVTGAVVQFNGMGTRHAGLLSVQRTLTTQLTKGRVKPIE